MTAAIRYALALWDALTRYCDDGHLEIDINKAERALRALIAVTIKLVLLLRIRNRSRKAAQRYSDNCADPRIAC